MQIKILKTLIILQEALVDNSEYLNLLNNGSPEEAEVELVKSLDKLENFRDKFKELSQKVDLYLR